MRPPPWRFQTKHRRASRKRPPDCSRRVLTIGSIMFGSRSIFDPVMTDQRSNFRKFHDSVSRVNISKTIDRSGMKPSPAYSPFNYAWNVLFWCISVEYLGCIVLLMDDIVSPRWRNRSNLWRHESATWHSNMIDIYIHTYIFIMHQYLAKKTTKSQNKTHLAEITPLMYTLRSVRLRRDSPQFTWVIACQKSPRGLTVFA